MASFQEGNDPHLIFIEVANTENTIFTNLVEVQPSSQVAGSWQSGGVVDQQVTRSRVVCVS